LHCHEVLGMNALAVRVSIHAFHIDAQDDYDWSSLDASMGPRNVSVNLSHVIAVRHAISTQAFAHRLGELSFAQVVFNHRKSPGLSVMWRRGSRRRTQQRLDGFPLDWFPPVPTDRSPRANRECKLPFNVHCKADPAFCSANVCF
jgi:hypothetical protein